MPLTERLGSFYLGKKYDLEAGKILEEPVHYDSRDLTTHAVCLGMTGSGKTGLCISLLEEAALDNVPAIIIDPKGDMANLFLTFPELRPEDFQPWINPDDAGRKGLSVEEFAQQTAASWREGLAQWDQGPERIRLLKAAADLSVYTPGSTSGRPISILDCFNAPNLDWALEEEALRERIQGTVSALLGLVGIDADPLRSREHILLSTLLEHYWRAGESVDLGKLILAVQDPPIRRLGVLDLDSFFPQKDRVGLSMMLNNIVASPAFAAWLTGDALDIGSLLHTAEGKPRHTIFYIAHLSDAERMFFVTILLEQVITWMRSQPGTTSLRALLYMDEVFGFFPPVAQPPSKRPMLTLLKQARAFGLGCVLTTQNPVDLDYKGLSNAGTWFIGRLQTERDKDRVLDGLEGVIAESGASTNRQELDRLISTLGSRVFLLHNVHEEAPVVMYTRWAMSYLRGPLTRSQIRDLVGPLPVTPNGVSAAAPGVPTAAGASAVDAPGLPDHLGARPPALPVSVPQAYLPVSRGEREALREWSQGEAAGSEPGAVRLVYEPALLGLATVNFLDSRSGADEARDYARLILPRDLSSSARWDDAVPLQITDRDLDSRADADALFVQDVPAAVDSAAEIKRLEKDWSEALYRGEQLLLSFNPKLKLHSKVGETEDEFRARCRKVAEDERGDEVDDLESKYKDKLRGLQQKVDQAERDVSNKRATYDARKREEAVSWIETAVGWLGIFGRKKSLSSGATKRRLTGAALAAVQDAEAILARRKEDIEDLAKQEEREVEALARKWNEAADTIEEYVVRPRRTDVRVTLVTLAWAPSWEFDYEDSRGRTRTTSVPAYVSREED